MRLVTRFAASMAALACAALPASAVAQEQRCVTRAESRAVVAHLMPALLTSVQKRCATQLDPASFLNREGQRLARALQPQSQASWPAARRALERQGGNPLPDNEALLNFGRQAIADGVANSLDADRCRLTDELLGQLAPLPAQNLANVFALFLEAGLRENKNSPLKVCEAS